MTVPLLAVARPGLQVLIPDNVYWPTRRFCDQSLRQLGVETIYYDPLIGSSIADLMRPDGGTVLFTEAPGSNTFEMPDLTAFLAAAKAHDAVTMIDNTWATPLSTSLSRQALITRSKPGRSILPAIPTS